MEACAGAADIEVVRTFDEDLLGEGDVAGRQGDDAGFRFEGFAQICFSGAVGRQAEEPAEGNELYPKVNVHSD